MIVTGESNIVQIIDKILNKIKSYLDSLKCRCKKCGCGNNPKQIKKKLRYNKHGFPTYSHRTAKDSELNKNAK